MARRPPIIIKKYGNRRLYDTGDSRYVTLDELAAKVRHGADVRVVDAKTNEDLTQVTLTQIIIEGRGAAKLLPVALLTQLIRLGDDALAEFFGRYVSAALGMYLRAKRGAQAVAPYNPFASAPLAATDALARMWMSSPLFGGPPEWPGAAASGWPALEPEWEEQAAAEPPIEADEDDDAAASHADVAALRRELEELKQAVRDAGGRGGDGGERRSGGRSGARSGEDGRRQRRGGSKRKR